MATTSTSFVKLLQDKQGFLLLVYGTLIAQLAITFGIVYSFRNHPSLSKATKQSLILYLLLSLGLVLLLTFVPMPVWLKLVLFTLLAIVNGGLLHQACVSLPEAVINQALLGTIGIFIALSIVGIVLAGLGIDLSWMGLILLAGLIGLLVASLVVMVLNKNDNMKKAHKVLLVIGLILFSIYIMYGTNTMLQADYEFDFVSAAIDLYLSFINVFVRLLGLDTGA